MKETDTTNLKRRSFLKGAAVSTVAVSSGAITAKASTDKPVREMAKPSQGYKETKHVKEYYRLARF